MKKALIFLQTLQNFPITLVSSDRLTKGGTMNKCVTTCKEQNHKLTILVFVSTHIE